MRFGRWLLRAFVALVVGILVLVAVGYLLLETGWGRERIRRLAVSEAPKYLYGQLAIGRLSGSLLHGVALDGVDLTQDGRPVFHADRVTVSYNAIGLARGVYALDTIQIDRASLHLVEAGGVWNVARLVRPQPPKPTKRNASFAIRQFTMRDSDVTVEGPGARARHLSAVNAAGSLQVAGSRVGVQIDRATLRDDRSGFVIQSLKGSLANGLEHVEMDAVAERAPATVTAHVSARSDDAGRHAEAVVDLTRLDLAPLLEGAQWTSDVTAHATLSVDMPAGGTPVVRFTAAGPHAAILGYETAAYRASGSLASSSLSFDASAAAYGAGATIRGDWQFGNARGTPAVFAGTGTFQDVALASLPAALKIPPFDTRLAGRYGLKITGGVVDAHVTLDQSSIQGATIAAGATGSFATRNKAIEYSGRGHIDGLDARRLAGPLQLPTLDAPRFESLVSGDFEATGQENCSTCEAPRMLSATATLDHAEVAGAHADGLQVAVGITGAELTITGHGGFSDLTDRALGLSSLPLTLNGRMDGTFKLPDLHAPVSPKTMAFDGVVDLTPSTVRGLAIRQAHVDASLEAGTATVRGLIVDAAAAHVTGDGTLAFGDTGMSALNLVIDADDLSVLGGVLQRPISGGGHLTARVEGPADHPVATGDAELRQLAYGKTASALTLNSQFTADVPGWSASNLSVAAKTDATFLSIAGTNIQTLTATTSYGQDQVSVEATVEDQQRKLQIAGSVALAAGKRALALKGLSMAVPGSVWQLPPGQAATIGFGEDRITIHSLRLESQAEALTVEGTLPRVVLSGAAPPPLTITAEHVRIADLNRLLLGTRPVDGLIDGTATVSGTVADPVVDADLAVTQGIVQRTRFDSFALKARAAGHAITVDATLEQTPANRLTIGGRIPWRSPGPGDTMDLQVRSTPIDLGLVQMFTTEVADVGGTADLDLHVTGQLSKPVVDGSAHLSAGAFTVPASGVRYKNANAAIAFTANHLQIETFSLLDDDGHEAHLVGDANLLGADPAARSVDVHLVSNGVHILDNQFGNLQVNADLTLSGEFGAPHIGGKIRLDSGRLEVDQILEQTTKSPYSETPSTVVPADSGAPQTPPEALAGGTAPGGTAPAGAAPAGPAPPPGASPFSQSEIAISLELPDNLVMRGRGLKVSAQGMGLGDMNITAGGTLKIDKAPGGDLTLTGDVSLVRGNYTFQGRRFEVQRDSDVRFRGEHPINPALDVTAERDVSGIAAQVHVRGTTRAPTVTISSVPPLDEADVLALIVFGQPLNDLGTSERTSLAQKAGAMAAGAIATPIADSVARALNLDTFEIQTPTDTESAPVVNVGSQIGSRIYVSVKQEIAGEENSAISFEYRFAQFLRLVTSFAQGALQSHVATGSSGGGVDLIFAFKY